MQEHFDEAVEDAHACPRMWSVHDATSDELVGFVVISDPAGTLASRDDTVGPYHLWRLG